MDALAPWLSIAATGVLHGLNPASGWVWAAAWRAAPGAPRGPALMLPAVVQVLVMVGAVLLPVAGPGGLLSRAVAWVPLLLPLSMVLRHRQACTPAVLAGGACMTLGLPATHAVAQAAGLALVPVLGPLCTGEPGAAGAVEAVWGAAAAAAVGTVVAAIAVHLAAMLATAAALAALSRHGVDACASWRRRLSALRPLPLHQRGLDHAEIPRAGAPTHNPTTRPDPDAPDAHAPVHRPARHDRRLRPGAAV